MEVNASAAGMADIGRDCCDERPAAAEARFMLAAPGPQDAGMSGCGAGFSCLRPLPVDGAGLMAGAGTVVEELGLR
jgi:hypothetical protein